MEGKSWRGFFRGKIFNTSAPQPMDQLHRRAVHESLESEGGAVLFDVSAAVHRARRKRAGSERTAGVNTYSDGTHLALYIRAVSGQDEQISAARRSTAAAGSCYRRAFNGAWIAP